MSLLFNPLHLNTDTDSVAQWKVKGLSQNSDSSVFSISQ
jgi:hypothetical protein